MAEHDKKPAEDQPDDSLDSLNLRQRLFVSYYLGEANGNATDAARRAGYATPNVDATRLLANTSIRAAINAALEGPAMAAAEVLARISEIASVDVRDFIKLDDDGKPTVNLKTAMAKGKTHLIKSIRPTKYGLSIEVHDPQLALDKLARFHGLYKPSNDESALAALLVVAERNVREKLGLAQR